MENWSPERLLRAECQGHRRGRVARAANAVSALVRNRFRAQNTRAQWALDIVDECEKIREPRLLILSRAHREPNEKHLLALRVHQSLSTGDDSVPAAVARRAGERESEAPLGESESVVVGVTASAPIDARRCRPSAGRTLPLREPLSLSPAPLFSSHSCRSLHTRARVLLFEAGEETERNNPRDAYARPERVCHTDFAHARGLLARRNRNEIMFAELKSLFRRSLSPKGKNGFNVKRIELTRSILAEGEWVDRWRPRAFAQGFFVLS